MFLPLRQTASLEPDYSNCGNHRAIPMTDLYLKVVPRWNGIVSEMKHQDSEGDPYKWRGGHWRNLPLNIQHGQSI